MARHFLQPGERFAGRYVVGELLGRGSMGTVYRAEDGTRGAIALKVMSANLADDPKAARRFQREAEAGRAIASDHVAKVLDSGLDPVRGLPWLALEFVEGEPLDAFVETHFPLPRATSLDLLRQIFDGVAAAHEARVVHRDLKPENIIVGHRPDGRPHVKILDFGVAKSLTSQTALETQAGYGTPMWVAPEQARDGVTPHPRADVWALGLIAFFLLTGKNYWLAANSSASAFDLAIELLQAPIEPPTRRAAALGVTDGLPEGFDAWFARAVHRDAAQRFGDASEAKTALSPMLDGRRQRRHRFWLPVEAPALTGGIAMSHDVSERGLLLVAKSSAPPGTLLDLVVHVPGVASRFPVRARVLRSSPNEADPHGLWPHRMAVEFITAVPELDALLANRDSPARSRPRRA